MATIKDAYEIVKDLMSIAKKARNQEVIDLAMNLQTIIFDLREQSEKDKQEIKALNERIAEILKSDVVEENIEYSHKGFFTIKTENPQIPYCTHCWKRNKILVPLAQKGVWWQYSCPECRSDIAVTRNGKELNQKEEGNGGN